MATTLCFLMCWVPWLDEGLRHQALAAELEQASCRVRMSHMDWVELEPEEFKFEFDNQGRIRQPVSTPVELQSTLPAFFEWTSLSNVVGRIQQVSVRRTTEAEFDQMIETLAKVKSVDTISVYARDFGVQHLSRLMEEVRVRKLYLRGMALPRESIPTLSQEGIVWLSVCHTQFSNPAIEDLPQSLTYFDATRTRISDDGLTQFVAFKNLKGLNLRRTPTSERAVEDLRKQMPWCKIHWEPLQKP